MAQTGSKHTEATDKSPHGHDKHVKASSDASVTSPDDLCSLLKKQHLEEDDDLDADVVEGFSCLTLARRKISFALPRRVSTGLRTQVSHKLLMEYDESEGESEVARLARMAKPGGMPPAQGRLEDKQGESAGNGRAMPSSVVKSGDTEEDEEDDYMSMAVAEPQVKETSLQRIAREKRERHQRSHQPARTENEKQADLEISLATAIDPSNKGFKMMEKLGFKGGALGKGGTDSDARTEPIRVETRDKRTGIGAEQEKKRKFREAAEKMEGEEKRMKLTAEEFRARAVREAEEQRLIHRVRLAMKVADELSEKTEQDAEQDAGDDSVPVKKAPKQPLQSVNVLWRGLVKERLEKERSRKMRYDLQQIASRLPQYDDAEEDSLDRQALGRDEEGLDEDDAELDEFNALEPSAKLQKLVEHLRTAHRYCFWCKTQYPDAEMDGCPGLTEDEHG